MADTLALIAAGLNVLASLIKIARESREDRPRRDADQSRDHADEHHENCDEGDAPESAA